MLGSDAPDAAATSWADVRAMLENAELFWISTVRADGRPHVTPLPAVWREQCHLLLHGRRRAEGRQPAEQPELRPHHRQQRVEVGSRRRDRRSRDAGGRRRTAPRACPCVGVEVPGRVAATRSTTAPSITRPVRRWCSKSSRSRSSRSRKATSRRPASRSHRTRSPDRAVAVVDRVMRQTAAHVDDDTLRGSDLRPRSERSSRTFGADALA